MQKVEGVDAVRVSLQEGLTVLDLKADNAVTLAKLRQIIKNNGFVSREALIVARGESSGAREFVVSGTGERLVLSRPPERTGENWKAIVAPPSR